MSSSQVTSPTVKGRGVFKTGLTAVIPAVTIYKGTKPPPEQLFWGLELLLLITPMQRALGWPSAPADQVCDPPGVWEARPWVSSLSPVTLSADLGSCCRQLKCFLCT